MKIFEKKSFEREKNIYFLHARKSMWMSTHFKHQLNSHNRGLNMKKLQFVYEGGRRGINHKVNGGQKLRNRKRKRNSKMWKQNQREKSSTEISSKN